MQTVERLLRRCFGTESFSRPAREYEYRFVQSAHAPTLHFEFFTPRDVKGFRIRVPDDRTLCIASIGTKSGGEWFEIAHTLGYELRNGQVWCVADLFDAVCSEVLRITLSEPVEESLQVLLYFARRLDHDVELVEQGLRAAARGELEAAVRSFERYSSNYSDENPEVEHSLALWLHRLGRLDEAERHAMRATGIGNFEVCVEGYRSVQASREPRTVESIRAAAERARDWDPGTHPGAVVLESRRELLLEVGGGMYVERQYDLQQIQRRSAARMMSQVGYRFRAGREAILHASCRIIRGNGDVETVPLERATVRDDAEASVAIEMESERFLIWILPELAPGDVIETAFHTMAGLPRAEGGLQPAFVRRLAHPFHPTFDAVFEVVAPRGLALCLLVRNGDAAFEVVEQSLERVRWRARQRLIVPTRQTGFEYESYSFDPIAVVGSDGLTWGAVAAEAKKNVLGQEDDDTLPARLAEIIADTEAPAEALERCFYLVRDGLKYASTFSAKRRIGVTGRAEQILQTGVGDCADKSHLLHLVCRALGIPHELVLVDTRHGVLVEDLPMDSFDHVFLHVRLGDEDLWLDATDRLAAFRCAPLRFQGMPALRLDDVGTRVTVAEDMPERNRIEVHERFDVFDGDVLTGEFELAAHGTSGRIADEIYKATSLWSTSGDRGAARSLRRFLPDLSLRTVEVRSHTTSSSVFHVAGRHARARLTRMRGSPDAMAQLQWTVPHLAIQEWHELQTERFAALTAPMILRIEVEFSGEVSAALVDHSLVSHADTPLYTVTETVDSSNGTLKIAREFVLRRRLVEAPLSRSVGDLCDAAASLLSLSVQFRQ